MHIHLSEGVIPPTPTLNAGYLTPLRYLGKRKGFCMWECRCLCGSVYPYRGSVKGPHSIRCRDCGKKSGGAVRTKHGLSRDRNGKPTPEHRAWTDMIRRCSNPRDKAYPRYGGRGITVCSEWESSFSSFFESVGFRPSKRHSLDRIDNSKGYYPENVRWATTHQQANNRRTNTVIRVGPVELTVTEWAKERSIPRNTLYHRIKMGMHPQKAVLTPIRKLRK